MFREQGTNLSAFEIEKRMISPEHRISTLKELSHNRELNYRDRCLAGNCKRFGRQLQENCTGYAEF